MLDIVRSMATRNSEIISNMVANADDDQSRQLAERIRALNSDYNRRTEGELLPLLANGKKDKATEYAAEVLSPIGREMTAAIQEYQVYRNEAIDKAFGHVSDSSRALMMSAMLFAAASAVIGILVGLFAADSISKPIKTIATAAERIAAGDLTDTVVISRNDEIGTLASAFNRMSEELKALIMKVSDEASQVAASSQELTASAEQSAQAAGQIAESVGGMAGFTQEQEQATSEAVQVIRELSSSAANVSTNTLQASDQAQEAAKRATEGIRLADGAVRQINLVRDTVTNTSTIVEQLGERSREVDQIVDAIAAIADQTNLLALNAAIEAARAGEQGRGFSVVAEEVRKLAEQSQEATKRIAAIIRVIQDDTAQAVSSMAAGTEVVQQGTVAVQEAGKAFHAIAGLIGDVSGQVAGIASEVSLMAEGNQEVVNAIGKVDGLGRQVSAEAESISAATEEQLASMEEIAGASQMLSRMAEDLQLAVSRFKL